MILGYFAVLLAVAAEAAIQTEHATSFPLLSAPLLASEFTERFWRHGAVLLRLEPSRALLQEAFSVLDPLLATQRIVRSSPPSGHNVSVNPGNSSTGGSPLRIGFKDHHQLAPADHTVQGPHQEGLAPTRGNRRAIVFVCETPAAHRGGTALFDMQRAWELLPPDLKRRLANASFGYVQHHGRLTPVPAVVRHDITGAPCLQFYCFGRLRHACADAYRERTGIYDVWPDPYSYELDHDADAQLISANGTSRPFIGLDLYRLLSAIYETMIVQSWEAGQVLVADNVRWAHARLEGEGRDRKIHFFHYGPSDKSFDLRKLARPSI